MTVFQAFIFGLVQGLCEFLPVSSSGHLFLLEELFGLEGDYMAFHVVVHLGTLLAVVAAFWKELVALVKHPFVPLTGKLALTTVITVVFALVIEFLLPESFFNTFFRFGFLITAAILFLCHFGKEWLRSPFRTEVRTSTAAFVGVVQGIACLPGISRSGSTIAAALFCGESRESASRFSFLASIPIILGSVVFELLFQGGMGAVSPLCLTVGFLTSAIFGFFSVRLMLRIAARAQYLPFAFYTLVLGAVSICL